MSVEKLKAALAKMLPDVVNYTGGLRWVDPVGQLDTEVLDAELLHLCSLVSRALPDHLFTEYIAALAKNSTGNTCVCPQEKDIYDPTWQQRTEALAKIKQIEL